MKIRKSIICILAAMIYGALAIDILHLQAYSFDKKLLL